MITASVLATANTVTVSASSPDEEPVSKDRQLLRPCQCLYGRLLRRPATTDWTTTGLGRQSESL